MNFPHYCIQENWNEILGGGRSEKEEKVWISMKRKKAGDTVRGYIDNNNNKEELFSIASLTKNKLIVNHNNGPEHSCTFVAPDTSLKLHDKSIHCCDISNSGGLGVCGSQDGYLWVWDTSTGENMRNLEGHFGDIESCQFFPSGTVILSGGDDFMLKIWSAIDGRCARTLTGHRRRVTDTLILGKGRNILSTSADGKAILWDCGSGASICHVTDLQCQINKCDMITNNSLQCFGQAIDDGEIDTRQKELLVACDDGTIRLYDIFSKQQIVDYSVNECNDVTSCMFVNETQFIIGCNNGLLLYYDIRSNSNPLIWSGTGSSSCVTSINRINNDVIIGYKDGTCIIMDIISVPPSVTATLTGPNVDSITTIITNNNVIYTSCRDGIIRIYN